MWVAFAFAKATHIFFSKNTCELDIVLTRTVNNLTTNELVKLRRFEQLGPAEYRIYPKYSDNLIPYRTCSKTWKKSILLNIHELLIYRTCPKTLTSILLPVDVSKTWRRGRKLCRPWSDAAFCGKLEDNKCLNGMPTKSIKT